MQQGIGTLARGAGLVGEQVVLAEQVAHQPAAVAPGSAEAGNLAFEDDDAQVWRLALEVIGGPQAGVAGADDGHIGVQVFGQRGAGGQRFGQLIHPQAEGAPWAHRRSPAVNHYAMRRD